MTRDQLLASCFFTLMVASPARAETYKPEGYQPEMPWLGSSGEVGQVSTRVGPLKRDLGCPRDDTERKRGQVAEIEKIVATIQDPRNKQILGEWSAKLRIWFDAHVRGVPEVGTWAEIDQTLRDGEALIKRLEGITADMPVGADKIKEKVDALIALRTYRNKMGRYSTVMQSRSPCPAIIKTWIQHNAKIADRDGRLNMQVGAATQSTLLAYAQWRKPPEGPVPTTYWEHVAHVMHLVDAIKATHELAIKLEGLQVWAPLLPPDKAAVATTGLIAIRKSLAAWEPLAVAELAKIAMPPMKKDVARSKLLTRALAGNTDGKQVGSITTGGAVSKQAWTEQVVVAREARGVWVGDVQNNRDYFSVYYGWQPTLATTGAPELPGVASGATCELWTMSFTRSSQGSRGPSGEFAAGEAWRLGYIPCANVTKTSQRKL